MKRRSFFGSLVAGISGVVIGTQVGDSKSKSFWERNDDILQTWTMRLKADDGKFTKHRMIMTPRNSPPETITYDGRHYDRVSFDAKERTGLYRPYPTLEERVAKSWSKYEAVANPKASLDDVPVMLDRITGSLDNVVESGYLGGGSVLHLMSAI